MPGQVPPIVDERDGLLAYLRQMRLVLRLTAYGLTDDQARRAAVASTGLSVGGLIKHVAAVESSWVDMILEQSNQDPEAYADNFTMRPDETLAGVLAGYEAVAERTESVIDGIADLGQAVPVPKGVPWFPQDLDAWSVRWVLLHLIQETARHAGHADIVREAVDGATAFPLMAAAEGWPETPWMQPWRPAADVG
jgi:uncharacterized damage-inducible protein DinB